MRVISGRARGTTLHSIESISTRPTLDRVKESLFNIIQDKISDAVVLDLFAGSGALAIEALSRGAKKAYLCDNSKEAVHMIKNNLEKTKYLDKAEIYNTDYMEALEKAKYQNIKFDLIFLDPPYQTSLAVNALKEINKKAMLSENGIIVIETDDQERVLKEIEGANTEYIVYDLRKYGRAHLIFLRRKES